MRKNAFGVLIKSRGDAAFANTINIKIDIFKDVWLRLVFTTKNF